MSSCQDSSCISSHFFFSFFYSGGQLCSDVPFVPAAFVFALAVFITLQVFPPQLDPYPELDREEAVLSGTIDSIEYKQDYKQSYARRGAQDGQQKHEEPEKGEVSLRVTVTDYTLEQVGGRDLRLRSDRSVLCTVDASYAELLTVGSRIRIRGKIYCFSPATNPGQFDSLLYYKTLGYDFRLLRTEVTESGPVRQPPLLQDSGL